MRPMPGRLVLLGHPVAHSRSPAFQNAALRAAGLTLVYEPVDVPPEDLTDIVHDLRGELGAGNVTVPHKERMHDQCDALSPIAERVGAVNTFWMEGDGRLFGDNTDVGGFDRAVTSLLGLQPRDLVVGLIGAGGAAAAVLAAVESWPGCSALVFNRTRDRARALCARFSSVAQSVDDIRDVGQAHLVVNATTVGLNDDGEPIPPDCLSRSAIAVDLVYRRSGTEWIQRLLAEGRVAMDGSAMLVEQGALAFEKWFGITPDRSVMWRAFAGQ